MVDRVDIEGFEDAMRALRNLPRGIAEGGGGSPLRKGMAAGAREFKKVVEQNLQGRGPGVKNKRTGDVRLKDSIRIVRDTQPDKPFTERYVIGPRAKAYWAPFVELGTEKQPARPFLAPAFETEKENVVQVFARSLRERLAQLVEKAKGR